MAKTSRQLDRDIAHALKKPPKKQGVYITSANGTNTKEIWNRGYRMMQYRQQPKTLRFKHRMVNDANQDLCGGWCMMPPRKTASVYARKGYTADSDEVLRRVAKGLKPLGIAHAIKDRAVADRLADDLTKKGLDVRILDDGFGGWNIAAAQPKTLRDLFDLDALTDDYVANGIDIRSQVPQYANRRLISFAKDYDDVAPWVTGLILGFPIENTISLYRGATTYGDDE
jgi:hypothetical protein